MLEILQNKRIAFFWYRFTAAPDTRILMQHCFNSANAGKFLAFCRERESKIQEENAPPCVLYVSKSSATGNSAISGQLWQLVERPSWQPAARGAGHSQLLALSPPSPPVLHPGKLMAPRALPACPIENQTPHYFVWSCPRASAHSHLTGCRRPKKQEATNKAVNQKGHRGQAGQEGEGQEGEGQEAEGHAEGRATAAGGVATERAA